MADIAPEIVERLVALARGIAVYEPTGSYPIGNVPMLTSYAYEARRILELLPDPDVAESRRIISEHYGPTQQEDGRPMPGNGVARVRAIRDGRGDDYWEMRVVKAAIKRGRELERDA